MTLSDYMKAHGLSQADLSRRLEVSETTVMRYLGGRVPEPKTLQKLIDLTEAAVTANDFFVVPATAPAE